MLILIQFIYRLSFGLALSMAITSPKKVTSGYYRNHLYVLLGLNVLGCLVAMSSSESLPLWPVMTASIIAYIGSVCWLYEKPKLGILSLVAVSLVTLAGSLTTSFLTIDSSLLGVLAVADPISSGLTLGSTIAAMFLGHWYLNSPTMQMQPLQRLVQLMVISTLLRAIVCGVGLAILCVDAVQLSNVQFWLLVLRWLAGIFGTLLLCWMTWQTLKIPNTQSATGIIYVAVITTFLGELTAHLLSFELGYSL